MRDVQKFLKWKADVYTDTFNPSETLIMELNDTSQLFKLSKKACHYTKGLMKQFTEFIWQENINNQLQLEGWSHIPKVTTTPLSLPSFTSREIEVLIMSLFYKNNLLNSFLFNFDRLRWASPLCSCGIEEQTAIHILTSCCHADESLRDQATYHLSIGNEASNLEELGTVAILNCSRDPGFTQVCRDIVVNENLQLRRKICLQKSSNSTRSTHA